MRCVLYHVGPYKRDIQDALYSCSLMNGIEIEFIVMEEEMGIGNALNEEGVLFYLLADGGRLSEMRIPWSKKIALCQNFEEGIQALEEGSDYALQIPINKERLLRCCEFLCQGIEDRRLSHERKNY